MKNTTIESLLLFNVCNNKLNLTDICPYTASMKFLVKILSTALAILAISTLMPGVEVQSLPMALVVSLVLIAMNVYVKPILVFLTFPITIVTLGLFLLVINASIILITSHLLKDGFKVDGFWVALLFSIVLSMTTSLIDHLTEKKETERW